MGLFRTSALLAKSSAAACRWQPLLVERRSCAISIRAVGEDGFTFQVGTLSGNPLASVAGLKTLEILKRDGMYETLIGHGERLMAAMSDPLTEHGIAHQIVGDPVLFDVIFTADPVLNYRDMKKADAAKANIFNAACARKEF